MKVTRIIFTVLFLVFLYLVLANGEGNLSVQMYLENSTAQCNSNISFIINLTNNNAFNMTDILVNDTTIGTGIMYNNNHSSPNEIDFEVGQYVYWIVNISNGSTSQIFVNFSTGQENGNYTNIIIVSNSSGYQLPAVNASYSIIGNCSGGGDMGGGMFVNLGSPDEITLTSSPFVFNYNVTGSASNINCSLWGNFSETWEQNQTSSLVFQGQTINFTLDSLSDGSYLWNVYCSNGTINEWGDFNQTFSVLNPEVDIVAPEIHSVWPENESSVILAHQSFDWNMTDNVQIANLTRYLWNSSDELIDTNSTNLNGTSDNSSNASYYFEYELSSYGDYYWNLYGCDDSGNCAWSQEGNYTFTYSEAPINITLIKYLENGTAECNSNISFIINVTNNNDYNLTNIIVNDTGIGSSISYTANHAIPNETFFEPSQYIKWVINVSTHNTSQIFVNFTTGGTGGNYTNYINVTNSSGNQLAATEANYTLGGSSCMGNEEDNFMINLTFPSEGEVLTPASSFVFNYTLNSSGMIMLYNCSLWGNFTGTWAENQTNSTNLSFTENNSLIVAANLSESSYLWNVKCIRGDLTGYWASSNRTFSVSTDDLTVQNNLTGYVKYSNGFGIEDYNLTLSLEEMSTGNETTTDSNGYYSFTNFEQGLYSLEQEISPSQEYDQNLPMIIEIENNSVNISGDTKLNLTIYNVTIYTNISNLNQTNYSNGNVLTVQINATNNEDNAINFTFFIEIGDDAMPSSQNITEEEVEIAASATETRTLSVAIPQSNTQTNPGVSAGVDTEYDINYSNGNLSLGLLKQEEEHINIDTPAIAIYLVSPPDGNSTADSNVSFQYNVTKLGSQQYSENCTLVLNSVDNASDTNNPISIISGSPNYNGTINVTLSNGDYNWTIKCSETMQQDGMVWASSNRTFSVSTGGVDNAPSVILDSFSYQGTPINSYVNVSGQMMLFVGEEVDIKGEANDTDFANWTISLTNSSGIVNSSLCSNNSAVGSTFCSWNTTEYCAGECENYTIILNATDSSGNTNSTFLENITIDNSYPSIGNISTNSFSGTPSTVVGDVNISDEYLLEVDGLILNENNSLVFESDYLCNKSETNCVLPGNGEFNFTWSWDNYFLNGVNVPIVIGRLFTDYSEENIAIVPGCLDSTGDDDYDCGGLCLDESVCYSYRWYLVYNMSTTAENRTFLGLTNEQLCSQEGCLVNTSIIQNGASNFKAQSQTLDFENGQWIYENVTEIILYSINNESNLNLSFAAPEAGNYSLAFIAYDYWWAAINSVMNYLDLGGMNSSLNISLNNFADNGFVSEVINFTGYVNGTDLANWTISVQNLTGVVNSSLCFGDNSVDGVFCSWNTTEYCDGECENYTVNLTAVDFSGDNNYIWQNNIIIDNHAPDIDILLINASDSSDVLARANITDGYLEDVRAYLFNDSNMAIMEWGRFCGENQTDNCQTVLQGTFNKTWGKRTFQLNNSLLSVSNKLGFNDLPEGTSTILVPGCFAQDGENYECGGVCGNLTICDEYRWWLIYNDSQMSSKNLLGLISDKQCIDGCQVNESAINNSISKFKPQVDIFNFTDAEWYYENLTEITLYTIGNSNNQNVTFSNINEGNFSFAFEAEDSVGWTRLTSMNFSIEAQQEGNTSTNITLSTTLLNSERPNVGETVMLLINVTNTGSNNITNITFFDIFDVNYNYTNASLVPDDEDYDTRIISWNNISVNLTQGQSYLLYLNFTALLTANNAFNTANITVYASGDSLVNSYSYDFEIGENINPTVIFIDDTSTEAGNYSKNAIWANISVGDSSVIDTITIFLFNSTGLYNSSTNNTIDQSNKYMFTNFTNLPEGTYRLNATANDTWGNSNSTETRIIILDTHSPVVYLVSPEDNMLQNTQNTTHTFNVTDSSESVNCTMFWQDQNSSANIYPVVADGSTQNVPGVWTLGEGVSRWYINCTDGAGNVGTSETRNITIDTISPLVNIIYPQNTNYLVNVSQFNYSYSDANSEYCWYSNSNGIINSSAVLAGVNFTGVVSSEGNNTWEVYCNDSAGNINSSSITFLKDTIAPSVSFISPLNQTYYTNNITVNISSDSTNSSIWWSNSTVNLSYSSPVALNLENGVYTFAVWANDSLGNLNSSSVVFTVDADTISPQIILYSPSNVNYTTTSIVLNVTATDHNEINKYWYNLNSEVNTTFTPNITITASQGTNNLTVYVNDTAGNTNFTNVTFYVDSFVPAFSVIPSSTNINYTQGFGVDFDATDSNLDSFRINWTTLFTINQTGYLKNSSVNIPAGSYTINVTVNDSLGNINSTLYSVIVNKIASVGSLLLNGVAENLEAGYPSQINASFTNSSSATLLKNGTDITSLNNLNQSLASGYYNFTLIIPESENKTGLVISRFANIIKAETSTSLIFDKSSSQVYGTAINASCLKSEGEGSVVLYRNSTDVTESENNQLVNLSAGTYNYSCQLEETQNYTAASNSSNFTITKAAGNISLLLNGTSGNITFVYGNQINASLYTLYGTATLYRNGTITTQNNTFVFPAAGYYNYTAVSVGDENHSSASVSYFLNVTKATPTITKKINGIDNNRTIQYPQQVNASGSTDGSTLSIYRDDINISNGNNYTLGAGYYRFDFNVSDNENYTSASSTLFANVTKGDSSLNLYLNNSEGNASFDIGDFGTSIWINATADNSQGNILLYKNGTLLGNKTSPVANYTIFNSTGLYNITAIYNETENYTASTEILWVNATDGTAPMINVLSPGSTDYFTGQLIGINFTASDLSDVSSRWYKYNAIAENLTFNGTETNLDLTNGTYTFTFYANDSYNNVASKSINITIEEIEDNQILLNESSLAVGENTTELVLPANQNLSTITIPSDRAETDTITLNLGQRKDSNGNMSFTEELNLSRSGDSENYSVEIPSDTVISGGSDWNGSFTLPTIKSVSGLSAPNISGSTTTLEKVITVGGSSELNFSNPVKLIIGGMAGKKAAWSRGSTFNNILVYCNSESSPTNINNSNSSARECYINDSTNTDLIIWTYHFTDFAAYSSVEIEEEAPAEEDDSPSSGGGGGGGGGGGSAIASNSTNITNGSLSNTSGSNNIEEIGKNNDNDKIIKNGKIGEFKLWNIYLISIVVLIIIVIVFLVFRKRRIKQDKIRRIKQKIRR